MSVVPPEGSGKPLKVSSAHQKCSDAFATVPLVFVLSDSCCSVWKRKQSQFVMWVVCVCVGRGAVGVGGRWWRGSRGSVDTFLNWS